ncbi:MAG: outer membrane protein assembly factor BamB, partial [Pseudomonadales bacterium]|nr:outer membrane protein assembly factor BamB [Pseudomonadales bacterium]
EDRAVRLVPAISGSRIFAVSPDGNVMALNISTGKPVWEVEVQDLFSDEEQAAIFPEDIDAITGGVGIGGDLVVVAVVGGKLVALNQSDGSLAWQSDVTSEVLAPPAVDRDLVVSQSIDGKVAAYDALDGTRQWLYSTSVPSLTLRGTATPILLSDLVIAGFANGRIVALNRGQGLPVMDERIAIAQGKSDLERLIDIDGKMVVTLNGAQLFVASYQGNLAAVDLKERRVRWMKEASTVAGLGQGFGNIYISSADSRVAALDMENSRESWENEALLYRDITAPVAISSYIVVGDFEGYIHFIAQSDGRFTGRRRVDGDGVTSPPVVEGSRVYILANSGRLYSYEIR